MYFYSIVTTRGSLDSLNVLYLVFGLDYWQLPCYIANLRGIIMKTTLDKFGRIVIPKKIREDFNLKPGSPIRIEEGKEEILLTPVEEEPTLVEKDGVLVFTGVPTEDIEKQVDIIRKQRSQLLRGF